MLDIGKRPYFYWKIRAAAEALVEGEGPLRQRILWALASTILLKHDELPADIAEIMLEIRVQATWKQDGDPEDGTFKNTLDAMSDADARKLALLILETYELAVAHIAGPAD